MTMTDHNQSMVLNLVVLPIIIIIMIIITVFIKRLIAKGYKALRRKEEGKDRTKIKTTSYEEAKRWVLRAQLKAVRLFELLVRLPL